MYLILHNKILCTISLLKYNYKFSLEIFNLRQAYHHELLHGVAGFMWLLYTGSLLNANSTSPKFKLFCKVLKQNPQVFN